MTDIHTALDRLAELQGQAREWHRNRTDNARKGWWSEVEWADDLGVSLLLEIGQAVQDCEDAAKGGATPA